MASSEGSVVIGVDGGGTKTAVVAFRASGDEDGSVLARKVVESSNRNSVGSEAAVAALRNGVTSVLQEAGQDVKDVKYIALCMSGCDTQDDVDFWIKVCKDLLPEAKTAVENDSVAALCSGTGGKLEGIVVISGTGSIGLGVLKGRPDRVRVGGMGPLLGDRGNGYFIGQAALAAVAKGEDGRGPKSPLRDLVLGRFGVESVDGLIPIAYGRDGRPGRLAEWGEVAGVAGLVMEAERKHGCLVARKILEECGDGVAEIAEAVAERLAVGRAHEERVSLVLAGGVLSDADSVVSNVVSARLAQSLPNTVLCRPSMEPAEAAARLAARCLKEA
mmetsp:Transcript_62077/g.146376  ORF Transcript_62077/g.146376 Transcript_62077/m.146376 type:complete len:331 (-) Transcript_62077:35-1027(-)